MKGWEIYLIEVQEREVIWKHGAVHREAAIIYLVGHQGLWDSHGRP